MSQPAQSRAPHTHSRHLALVALKQLQPGMRLDFDSDTYVIRSDDQYIGYRTWMSILPIIEVFQPTAEYELINWLEQHGYAFN